MKIQEIIVVEGRDDTIKVQQAVEADTIETNGFDVHQGRLKQIKHAQEKRGVIIFTDPDYAGEKIRQIIDQSIPGCKHAFLVKEKALQRKTDTVEIGIEHATIEDIREALAGVYDKKEPTEAVLTKKDLLTYHLIGAAGSKRRREALGKYLNIGEPNGKQLLKRLQMFHIQKEEFIQAMEFVRREEQDGQ